MKETLESVLMVVAVIVVAEVINGCLGYKCITVELDKNTIRNATAAARSVRGGKDD